MIYFPDERATGSWADTALRGLGYDENPEKLQAAIRMMFELATSRICIPGVQVEGFALFDVLDGKTSSDYVARVEPSASGGRKMAEAFVDRLLDEEPARYEPPWQHQMA